MYVLALWAVMCLVQAQSGGEKSPVLHNSIHPLPNLSQEQKQEVLAIVTEVEKQWLDPYGFMRLTPDPSKKAEIDNENPVLFTSEYLYLLWRLGMLEGELRERYREKILRMIDLLRLEPGLFNRRPGKSDEAFERHFSRDEQIGLVTLDRVFDWQLGFARELYNYGQAHHFFYQNRDWSAPGQHHRSAKGEHNSWLELKASAYRQPEFVKYLHLAVGERPNALRQSILQTGLRLSMKKPREETSGKILAYLRFEVLYGKDAGTDNVIRRYLQKMRTVYGDNPLYKILCIYYPCREGIAEHPLRRLAKMLESLEGKEEKSAPQDAEDTSQESAFFLPLPCELKELADMANQDPEARLFFCTGKEIAHNTTLELEVARNGEVSVREEENTLHIAVPLKFRARVDWFTKKLGVKIRHHEETSGALTVYMKAQVEFQQNGKIITNTELSFTWDERPYLEIGPARVRISHIAGSEIQRQLQNLSDRLNSHLENRFTMQEK